MKKIYTILLVAIIAVALGSCRKLALHGDFSGMWQVLTIEYPDGTLVESNHDYYYCFNRNVVMLREYGNKYVIGNMVYHETDFSLQFFRVSTRYLSNWGMTMPDAAPQVLDEFVVHFTVDERNSKHMVITSDEGITVTLRKY